METTKKKNRRKHPEEFKREAVRLLESALVDGDRDGADA